MSKEKKHPIPIHIPYNLWIKLRRLQEENKIKSIQEAAIKGLEWLVRKVK